MHMLPCFKFSSKMTLHDMPVFSNLFSINSNLIVYSWSALTRPNHNRANISCLFSIFWICNRCASARTIERGGDSIFGNIKRCGTNLTDFCFSIFSLSHSFFSKSFRNIKCHTSPTAKLLRVAPWEKFFIAMRTIFNFHSIDHSNRS